MSLLIGITFLSNLLKGHFPNEILLIHALETQDLTYQVNLPINFKLKGRMAILCLHERSYYDNRFQHVCSIQNQKIL